MSTISSFASASASSSTPLTNLFEKFLKDASKLCSVKKDTDSLIAQIIAHMATPECEEAALNNLERIFQRSFHTDKVDIEPQVDNAIRSGFNSPLLTKNKKTPELTEKKSKSKSKLNTEVEVEDEAHTDPVVEEVKEKKKSGPKPKAKAVPVVEEQEAPIELKEKKKPGPKPKTKAEPVVQEQEAPTELKEKKKPAGPKAKAKKETPIEVTENNQSVKQDDIVARLVSVTNDSDEELTEEDLLEIVDTDSE